MFKVSKSVLPSYVNQMFSFRPFNETLQSLRSTGELDFYTPRPHHIIIIGFLINVQVQGHHPHQWVPFQVTG